MRYIWTDEETDFLLTRNQREKYINYSEQELHCVALHSIQWKHLRAVTVLLEILQILLFFVEKLNGRLLTQLVIQSRKCNISTVKE